jgi:SAM-dependent methyltransferase
MRVEHLLALLSVVFICTTVSLLLFDLYNLKDERRAAQRTRRWFQPFGFSPRVVGGFSYASLILVSVLTMYLELLLIRWVSSEIRIFAYLKNFVLIACFLGFGLGCYLCRQPINVLPIALPLVLLTIIIRLPWDALRDVVAALPLYLGATTEVHMWGVPDVSLNWLSLPGFVGAITITVSLFSLLTLVFIPLGQLVGWYLENAGRGILSYSVNILASLAGIVLYCLICFLNLPPLVWFAVASAILVLLLWKTPRLRWTVGAAMALCLGLLSLKEDANKTVYWSPYQKLALTPKASAGETIAYELDTNGTWYQHIIDLSPRFVQSHRELFQGVPAEWNAYNLPFRFYRAPSSVLVLGAGMGNDVAAALRNGAQRVVAVEIDPLILDLGRRLHFEKPYDSPRVELVVDDARNYIQNARDRFDLVLFALLDSHTTSSHFSNIRIDNYVYTREALYAAKQLLQPGGLFIVKFQADTPWIAGRLRELLTDVFGHPPLQTQAEPSYTTSGRFFITGPQEQVARAMADPELAAYVETRGNWETEDATLTTDDWPYFYQHEPGLPASIIAISAILVSLSWLAIRRSGAGGRPMRWHFFFLGAGFLLLEVQIISKMALLFGTTWVVNSIVITGLLLLIVGANILVEKRPQFPAWLAYTGMLLWMALSYGIPTEALFREAIWQRGLVATSVLCAPVLFASMVFIQSFARAGFSGEALGSNLIGALVGGLLESLSLWTGVRSLLVVAAILYLASFLTMRQEARLRELPADAH